MKIRNIEVGNIRGWMEGKWAPGSNLVNQFIYDRQASSNIFTNYITGGTLTVTYLKLEPVGFFLIVLFFFKDVII